MGRRRIMLLVFALVFAVSALVATAVTVVHHTSLASARVEGWSASGDFLRVRDGLVFSPPLTDDAAADRPTLVMQAMLSDSRHNYAGTDAVLESVGDLVIKEQKHDDFPSSAASFDGKSQALFSTDVVPLLKKTFDIEVYVHAADYASHANPTLLDLGGSSGSGILVACRSVLGDGAPIPYSAPLSSGEWVHVRVSVHDEVLGDGRSVEVYFDGVRVVRMVLSHITFAEDAQLTLMARHVPASDGGDGVYIDFMAGYLHGLSVWSSHQLFIDAGSKTVAAASTPLDGASTVMLTCKDDTVSRLSVTRRVFPESVFEDSVYLYTAGGSCVLYAGKERLFDTPAASDRDDDTLTYVLSVGHDKCRLVVLIAQSGRVYSDSGPVAISEATVRQADLRVTAGPVLGLSTFARASGGGVNAELRGLARDAAAFSATNAREAALVYTASAAWMLAAAAAGGLVAAAVPPTS